MTIFGQVLEAKSFARSVFGQKLVKNDHFWGQNDSKWVILGGSKMAQKWSFWAFTSQVFGQKWSKMTIFQKWSFLIHFWSKTCEVKTQNNHFWSFLEVDPSPPKMVIFGLKMAQKWLLVKNGHFWPIFGSVLAFSVQFWLKSPQKSKKSTFYFFLGLFGQNCTLKAKTQPKLAQKWAKNGHFGIEETEPRCGPGL